MHTSSRHPAFAAMLVVIGALALACALPAHAGDDDVLPAPGRVRPVHPNAAAEAALAEAQALLDAGRPDDALAALPPLTPRLMEVSSQAFRRAHLSALALARAGRLADAAAPLRDARAATKRPLADGLELLSGRAELAAGDCAAALHAFRRAGDAVFGDADAAVAQARCQIDVDTRAAPSGERGEARALATLRAAPATTDVRSLRARLLVRAGLHEEARDDVAALAATLDAADLATLSLDVADAPSLADLCVQAGLARFPSDAAFPALAARLWQSRAPLSSARVAVRGAALDPRAAADAAELLRAAGDVAGARRQNARVTDAAQGVRQRLALAVDEGAWDRALAMRPALEDAGLLADDAVAYALAFASHSVGDEAAAERLLDAVDDAAWFERATTLRAAIARACTAGAACAR